MLKLISILFSFIKELVYDSKDEYNYMSPKFNVRKATIVVGIFLAFFVAYSSTKRVIVQSIYVVKLKDAILVHHQEEMRKYRDYEERIASLESRLSEYEDKGKKPRTAPSDSRNGAEKTISAPGQHTEQKTTSDKPETDGNKKPPHMTREQENAFFIEYIARKKL